MNTKLTPAQLAMQVAGLTLKQRVAFLKSLLTHIPSPTKAKPPSKKPAAKPTTSARTPKPKATPVLDMLTGAGRGASLPGYKDPKPLAESYIAEYAVLLPAEWGMLQMRQIASAASKACKRDKTKTHGQTTLHGQKCYWQLKTRMGLHEWPKEAQEHIKKQNE
ncbi:hypothetical protein MUN82_08860 [Hymenobacter aerilatus]|uniref:Uncharacterized protein n=1 Tax=Hymenobacter aerilatus TaxID=2932251 RepID=A0A8T9T2K8_9BACT|nr:hypothetical protein [Hymenobacter aerilatus]UOR07193.1 hypothetical protein MUN82_08860 [Hymenobacter aerilatus]